jgi:hypothetical protein
MSQPKTERMDIIQKVSWILSKIVQRNASIGVEKFIQGTQAVNSPLMRPWAHEHASVLEFLECVCRTLDCSDSCIINALCLLMKLEATSFIPITQRTVHRTFYACFVLSMKILEDETYKNKDFATVGYVPTQHLNEIEMYLIHGLQFSCCVNRMEYERVATLIGQLSSNPKLAKVSQSVGITTLTTLMKELGPSSVKDSTVALNKSRSWFSSMVHRSRRTMKTSPSAPSTAQSTPTQIFNSPSLPATPTSSMAILM